MRNYKVNSSEDSEVFVLTNSYRELYKVFQTLKKHKGRIIHVLGAPGTGKSTNIYFALNNLDLNVYDLSLALDNVELSPKEVFREFFNSWKDDLGVGSDLELYQLLSEYDVILFADKFHDPYFIDAKKVGFSKWTDRMGFKAFPFYLLCINEYIKHRNKFKNLNIVLQTSWRVYINGKKRDLFTDLGLLSKIMVSILKLFFKVVEISYSESETINIVKKHLKDVDEDLIKQCILKYGHKPRFICEKLREIK